MKRLIPLLFAVFMFVYASAQIAPDDYTVNVDDKYNFTIITASGGFSFIEIVNRNGNIVIYKQLQSFKNDIFKSSSSQPLSNEDNLLPLSVVPVEGLTLKEMKEKIMEIYSKSVEIKEIEIELNASRDRVMMDYNDRVLFKKYEINTKIYDYIITTNNGKNFAEDSIYVRRGDSIILLSIYDNVLPNDYIYISQDFVYITGEVKSPGPVPYNPYDGVDQYISKSGGLTHYGSAVGIKLMSREGITKSKSSVIKPGDKIHVPANYIAYIRDFNVVLQIIANVILSLLVNGFITF